MLRSSLRILKHGQYVYSASLLKLHTSAFPVLYSRFDKDLPNPIVPTPVSKMYGPDTDILLDQVKKCNSVDGIFQVISMHLDVMNSKHIVTCLEKIHSCIKNDDTLARSLMENDVFKSLCSRLLKVVRLLEPQELITIYKAFCALEVRSNTYLMQSVLKMLGAHLNNMNLGQLTFLNFLLHRQRHNILVDGLKLAIPLVLQVQVDQQLDSDNLKEIVNCLQLSCRSGLKPVTIQKIVNVILQKASFLSTEDAVTVIFSLLSIETPIDGYNELLSIAFETVTKNIEDLPSRKVCTILKTCRHQRYYHVTFFFRVAELIVSQKWNLELTFNALYYLHSLGFCPSNLLDHFADVLCLESKQFEENNLYSPLSCIEYLTATSYHPAKIDEAARVLYSNENKLEDLRSKNPHLFFKFHSCLAMVGHFPHKSLMKILDEDSLFSAWNLCKRIGRNPEFERYVLALFWSLKLYGEEKNFTIPPAVLKKVIQSMYQRNLNVEYPLTKFIEHGLGGSQFLQTGVCTEDGHIIDHIVAMRSGNYPVSLQQLKSNDNRERSMQNLKFVEDTILPEDAKVIAIIVAHESDYFRDPEILKGWTDLKVRSLAKKNHSVAVINYNVWKNLPDQEKIPYLMREIKQAIPNDFAERCNYN